MSAAKKCVLIVDDEKDLALMLEMTFRKNGYDAVCAHNGREALEIVKSRQVDAVVTDIRMPHGDGVEFLEQVRIAHPTKPVIVMVTGYADLTESDAYDKGAQALFIKPVDRKNLLEAVQRYLDANRLQNPAGLRTPRFSIELWVTVAVTGAEFINTRTVNIGNGGAFIEWTEQPLPEIGDAIEFKLTLPGIVGNTIAGEGICRWTREAADGSKKRGFGMEFLKLNPESQKLFLDYVEQLQTVAFIPRG